MGALCEYEEKSGWATKQLRRNNARNNVYSVAKTVVSLMAGIMEAQGALEPEKTSIWDAFPERRAEMAPAWKKVLLSHVLAHTTGYGAEALDPDQGTPTDWNSGDFLSLALREPLVYRPGERMIYSDMNYYFMSRVIAQTAGDTLPHLAWNWLFRPLAIYNAAWSVCPQGHAIGASGLFLTVEDMAKIGILMLQNGSWQGKQLVPADWIDRMRRERTCAPDGRGYGYGIWLRRDTQAYLACGMLGQLVFISPKTGRVFACQSCEDDSRMGPLVDRLVQLDNMA